MSAKDRSCRWPEGETPTSCGWITDELLLDTQEVWSEAYGRPIDRDEAIEILENVKRLAMVLCEIPPTLREGGPAEPPPEEELPQDFLSVMYRELLRLGYVKLPEQLQQPMPTPSDYQI